jgi:hypothetical protein
LLPPAAAAKQNKNTSATKFSIAPWPDCTSKQEQEQRSPPTNKQQTARLFIWNSTAVSKIFCSAAKKSGSRVACYSLEAPMEHWVVVVVLWWPW